ncbi:hypothetical protein EW146_g6205 [Bondarzewia mesenterica]|uniref:Uncharacterized protein n=1 Tax=Bondarzewia mesenterica TaxID=1095465 RepID=A0A4S4LPV2_9AGAM|nr:hypothetical protein EW146_g6205 [Bondarzewia mesenterica]
MSLSLSLFLLSRPLVQRSQRSSLAFSLPRFGTPTYPALNRSLIWLSPHSGLFSFASTTLILSLYNTQARHVAIPNVVVGMALFCGGVAQFVAGMWEFACGNSFGATAFSSYGAFWLSYATILIPNSGIAAAYAGTTQESDALGIYLITWMVVSLMFLIVSFRKSVGFIAIFSFLSVTFILLAAGEFKREPKIAKAGGGTGIVTAMIAYYVGLAELLAMDGVTFLPVGRLPRRAD